MSRGIVVIGTVGLIVAMFVSAALVAAQTRGVNGFQRCTQMGPLGTGDIAGAISCFEQFVKDSPSDRTLAANAITEIGMLSLTLGRADKARDYCQQAIAKYPEQTDAVTKAKECIDRAPASPSPLRELRMPYTEDTSSFAISPDGKILVFLATGANGRSQLWVRDIGSGRDQPIPGTESSRYGGSPFGAHPFWSPDGRSIGYFEDNHLKRIDVAGGNAKVLAEAPLNYGGAWNSDGTIIFAPRNYSPLFRMQATGGEPRVVTRLAPSVQSHRYPVFLPDGRHFLFFAAAIPTPGARSISMGSLDNLDTLPLFLNGSASALVGAAPAFVAPDRLLFVQNGALYTQFWDLEKRDLIGSTKRLASRIASGGDLTGNAYFSASASGPLAYREYASERRQLELRDRQGQRVESLISADASLSNSAPRFAQDGRTIAVQLDHQALVVDLGDGTSRSRNLGNAITAPSAPIWAGGNLLMFSASPDGRARNIFSVPAAGPETNSKLFFSSDVDKTPDDISSDGRMLLYTRTSAATGRDIMAIPVNNGNPGTPVPVVVTAAKEQNPRFSPNGQWIAYESDTSGGRDEVFVQPFPGTTGARRVSAAGGRLPQWNRDGRELYFLSADNHLMFVSVQFSADGQTVDFGKPAVLFQAALPEGSSFAPAHDGQQFLINAPTEAAPPIFILSGWSPDPAPIKKPNSPPPDSRPKRYGPQTQITVFDRQGNRTNTVGETGGAPTLSISHNGKQVAYARDGGIWAYEVVGNTGTTIASNALTISAPLWSPDNSRIAYGATRNGSPGTYAKASEGTGNEDLLTAVVSGGINWSLDGRFIATTKGTDYVAWRVGTRSVEIFFPTAGKTGLRISPDGRFVAYVEANQLWVQSFDPASAVDTKWPITSASSPGSSGMVRWKGDGKELYYLSANGDMMMVSIATAPEFKAGRPERLFRAPENFPLVGNPSQYADVSADGQHFVFVLPVSAAANGDPSPSINTQYVGGPVTVRPVFVLPSDANLKHIEDDKVLLQKHLRWARDRYKELLHGVTFNIFDKPLLLSLKITAKQLLASGEGGVPLVVRECLAADGLNRWNAPYVYLFIFEGTGDVPAGGGRPINGGHANGGGIVILSSGGLNNSLNFQSTLQHELGHGFGLPHVDAYGYDMQSNPSIMSYNRSHNTKAFSPSATPGIFIPEDLRGLAGNQWAFKGLTFDSARDLPSRYQMKRDVTFGPMDLDSL